MWRGAGVGLFVWSKSIPRTSSPSGAHKCNHFDDQHTQRFFPTQHAHACVWEQNRRECSDDRCALLLSLIYLLVARLSVRWRKRSRTADSEKHFWPRLRASVKSKTKPGDVQKSTKRARRRSGRAKIHRSSHETPCWNIHHPHTYIHTHIHTYTHTHTHTHTHTRRQRHLNPLHRQARPPALV